jgi:hypothetical protein
MMWIWFATIWQESMAHSGSDAKRVSKFLVIWESSDASLVALSWIRMKRWYSTSSVKASVVA